ncbi:MAG: esterase/lipase family protein, partial [Parachlamydiaceae bacterium]
LPQTKHVTILIHGFLHNRSVDAYWRPQLKKHSSTTGPLYTLNLGHPFQSIKQYAFKLRKLILQIQKHTPECQKLKINFVGHSMGGLVCTYYAVTYAEQDGVDIRKIITVASPFQGTKIAYLASPFCACAKEMLPNSSFLRQLRAKASQFDRSLFFHIGCGTDFIVSQHRSFLEGQNDHLLPYYGHMSPLYSSQVVKQIVQNLEKAL